MNGGSACGSRSTRKEHEERQKGRRSPQTRRVGDGDVPCANPGYGDTPRRWHTIIDPKNMHGRADANGCRWTDSGRTRCFHEPGRKGRRQEKRTTAPRNATLEGFETASRQRAVAGPSADPASGRFADRLASLFERTDNFLRAAPVNRQGLSGRLHGLRF
jgi:hypothetical protein